MAQRLLNPPLMIFRSAAFRVPLFLAATALAQAHPGHPGHDNDPYRMEGLAVPFPQLGFFLPLLTLGICLAVMQGKSRAFLAGVILLLMTATGLTHALDFKALNGLLASSIIALASGFVLGRAGLATRKSNSSKSSTVA